MAEIGFAQAPRGLADTASAHQADAVSETDSVTLCLLTAELVHGASWPRIDIEPSSENGLHKPSQMQIDKIATVPRSTIDRSIGRLEDAAMRQVEEAVRFFLDPRS